MSVIRRFFFLFLIAPLLLTSTAFSQETVSPSVSDSVTKIDTSYLKSRFEKLGVSVIDVQPSSIEGVVEITTNGGVFFSNPNGDQFIAGKLFSLDDNGKYVDLLAQRQAPLNAKKIEELKDDMIVYPAENEKYVITIFTDITCGYCIKLHSQMEDYNRLGITVRYLAFPREGLNGKGNVAENMAKVWCATEPKKALTEAKISHTVPEGPVANLEQCEKIIAEDYMLGQTLGIRGTPAIFTSEGMLIAGYMSPKALLEKLSTASE